MDEIISIWKPVNISSFDVIRKIKKQLPNIKIGHCGTLDPFAEGILILCTGKLTKNSSRFVELEKTYLTKIVFGKETDTLDKTGTIIKSCEHVSFNKTHIKRVLKKFIGNIIQSPPAYSAKKINGIKMYHLARKDIFIKRKGNDIYIHDIKIQQLHENELELLITCGKGTYIRSLARDIAYSLNTYGYVKELQRLSVGNYNKSNSFKFEDIDKCLVNTNSKTPIS